LERIKSHDDLRVFKVAFDLAIQVFHLTKKFPSEERYGLTDQVRRSSRSVCLNLGEAWRKRRYRAAFIAKLSDCEAEACETQIALRLAKECGYLQSAMYEELIIQYENVLGMLVKMISNPDQWTI
jgi:four helix bundle protein